MKELFWNDINEDERWRFPDEKKDTFDYLTAPCLFFYFVPQEKNIAVKLARLFDYLNLDIEGGDVVDGRLGDGDGAVNDDDDLQDVLPPPHACRGTPVRL